LVEINGVQSSTKQIVCGVPHGSILGPLLFNLYVNDMESAVNCILMLYADDSALVVSSRDLATVERILSGELYNLSKWLVDNKLSLHLGKTESLVFTSKKKIKSNPELKISCNNVEIKSVKSVKYLGIVLDQTLSGKQMANNIIQKTNSRLKFMYRQAQYLNSKAKKTLCNALIMSQFDYCSSTWYPGLTKTLKQKLQICQNKVVRFILNFGNRHHVGPDQLHRLNWVDTCHRVTQLRLNHVHSIYYEYGPSYLMGNFTKLSSVHKYRVLKSIKIRTKCGKISLKYTV